MSRYLIDRIDANAKIVLHANTRLTGLSGDHGELVSVSWQETTTGVEEHHPIRHVFLFVGADPETKWLADCGVGRDAHGFVLTGNASTHDSAERSSATLESSVAGVFAVGDVRAGSVKRVGAAIGEGAAVVAQIHQYQARHA